MGQADYTYHHHANPFKMPGSQNILKDMASGQTAIRGGGRAWHLVDQNTLRSFLKSKFIKA